MPPNHFETSIFFVYSCYLSSTRDGRECVADSRCSSGSNSRAVYALVCGMSSRTHHTFTSVHVQYYCQVGIVGATGAVGEEIIGCLAKRGFPVATLHAFASAKSAGKTVSAGTFGDVVVEEFSVEAARQMDVVFLAVDGKREPRHGRDFHLTARFLYTTFQLACLTLYYHCHLLSYSTSSAISISYPPPPLSF